MQGIFIVLTLVQIYSIVMFVKCLIRFKGGYSMVFQAIVFLVLYALASCGAIKLLAGRVGLTWASLIVMLVSGLLAWLILERKSALGKWGNFLWLSAAATATTLLPYVLIYLVVGAHKTGLISLGFVAVIVGFVMAMAANGIKAADKQH